MGQIGYELAQGEEAQTMARRYADATVAELGAGRQTPCRVVAMFTKKPKESLDAKARAVVAPIVVRDVLANDDMVLASTSYAEAIRCPCQTGAVRVLSPTSIGYAVGQASKKEAFDAAEGSESHALEHASPSVVDPSASNCRSVPKGKVGQGCRAVAVGTA